jgi:hypothetical protein
VCGSRGRRRFGTGLGAATLAVAAHRLAVGGSGDRLIVGPAPQGDARHGQGADQPDGGEGEDEDLGGAHRSKKIPSRQGKVKFRPLPR